MIASTTDFLHRLHIRTVSTFSLSRNRYRRLAVLFTLLFVMAGCGNPVNIKNPYVMAESDDAHVARVYFIRPQPYKYKGIADNEISVEYKNETLLKINEGQYTMVRIKPSKGEIITHSKTQFTNKTVPIDVSRARNYRFLAGKTYFIYLKRINEEFRGIFYDPAPVTYQQALKLATNLRARGLAKQEPITDISVAKEAPEPSPLEPALPEKMYPEEKYLIKGNPKYEALHPPEGKNEMTFDNPPEEGDKADTPSSDSAK
jgi:hypothetical protein